MRPLAEIADSVRTRVIRRDRSSGVSEEERQFKLQKALSGYPWPIDNIAIWVSAIGAIQRAKRQPGLSWDELQRIMDAYRELQPQGDISAASVVVSSGVADLRRDGFLSRVSFNYDWEVGGEARAQKDYENFLQGRGQILHANLRTGEEVRGYSDNEPEHWSFEDWVKRDLVDSGHKVLITQSVGYDKASQSKKTIYSLTGERGLIHMPNVWNFNGWDVYGNFRNKFRVEVFPLLKPDELVKAGHRGNSWGPVDDPRVVKKAA